MKIINYKELKKEDLYFCYSPNLRYFLINIKGLMPLSEKINKNSNKNYAVFVKDKQLQSFLDEWTENKKNGIYVVKGGVSWTIF